MGSDYNVIKSRKKERLKGKVSIPGDKSISHQAVNLTSFVKGKSEFKKKAVINI